MARKKKHEEHVNHERWLVSYADFITLLFAFFVIMYAISEVDKNKLKKFKNSVQFAFAHVGSGGTNVHGKNVNTFRPLLVGHAFPQGRRHSDAGPFESLTEVKQYVERALLKWFVPEERAGIDVISDDRGVMLRLSAERLFAPQSATVRQDRRRFLGDLGRVVGKFRLEFRVALSIEVPPDGPEVSEHELGARRTAALVRAIRSGVEQDRALYRTSVVVREVDGVVPPRGEKSRSVFDLMVAPGR